LLRDYQIKLINDIKKEIKEGHHFICIQSPCGSGKTKLMEYIKNNNKTQSKPLLIVHRLDLLNQLKSNLNIDTVMIQSLKSDDLTGRKIILIDECHHSVSKTYNPVFDYAKSTPGVYIFGFTATPERLDGVGLGERFDSLVIGPDADELIKNGFLSPYDYLAPNINLANAFYHMKAEGVGGEFSNSQIEKELDKQAIYGDIKKYIDFNKKTLIYCNSIATSKKVADILGNKVNHIDGSYNQEEREKIFKEFRNGIKPVITSVDLISEGLDFPDCDYVMLLRPTNSLNLYIQQSMRCLRINPRNSAKKAQIIDMVGNVYKFNLPTIHRDWTLVGKKRLIKRDNDIEVICRQCKNCLRVYPGTSSICPYCQNYNGKTKKQIEIEKEKELIEIKKLEKIKQGQARSYEQLVQIAKDRGYKNPYGWAYYVYNNRKKSI